MTDPNKEDDNPDPENKNHNDNVDILRHSTGGAKLENKVHSTETGAPSARPLKARM